MAIEGVLIPLYTSIPQLWQKSKPLALQPTTFAGLRLVRKVEI
jgi:hypothetical protein